MIYDIYEEQFGLQPWQRSVNLHKNRKETDSYIQKEKQYTKQYKSTEYRNLKKYKTRKQT
jgi:hypothetical protein